MSVSLQHQAQELVAAFPPLLLEAERVAHVVYQGLHGRRRAGTGETFWQFRRYEAGDSMNRIDWRQSARTQRLFVREREWEAAQTAFIWADCSGSMQYASSRNYSRKATRAQLLALALGCLLLRGGETIQWLNTHPIRVYGKNGLQRVAEQMQMTGGKSIPPFVPLVGHGQVLLCSDFLITPDEFVASMDYYAAQKRRGILLHILDPAEEQFSFEGRVEFLGTEGEASLLLPNAGHMADLYQKRLDEHKKYLAHEAQKRGWFYVHHVTTTSPTTAVLQLYNLLMTSKGM